MASLLSTSDVVRLIGSRESDWTQGYETAVGRWAGQDTNFQPVADRTVRRLEAFENGDTGWAAVEQEVTFETGETSVVRITMVLVFEDSTWKIAQIHFSVPLTN